MSKIMKSGTKKYKTKHWSDKTVEKSIVKQGYVIPKIALTFSKEAWNKLLYVKQKLSIEVSGFGITDPKNPLYVKDFKIISQKSTSTSTKMDDDALADFQDEMLSKKLFPLNFMRIWIHTHPGMGTSPSGTDEETFGRVFGQCDWAVMFILGINNKYSCALQYNKFPAGRFEIPVLVTEEVNEEWDKEIEEKVQEEQYKVVHYGNRYWKSNYATGSNYNSKVCMINTNFECNSCGECTDDTEEVEDIETEDNSYGYIIGNKHEWKI